MHDSDSTVQRQAETIIVEKLAKRLQKNLSPKVKFKIGNFSLEVDAIDDEGGLYEIYAHVGKLKPGHRKKIASDMLKLLLIEKREGKREKYIAIVNDNDIKNELDENSQSWLALAIKELGFNLQPVNLPLNIIEQIKKIQKRQKLPLKERRITKHKIENNLSEVN